MKLDQCIAAGKQPERQTQGPELGWRAIADRGGHQTAGMSAHRVSGVTSPVTPPGSGLHCPSPDERSDTASASEPGRPCAGSSPGWAPACEGRAARIPGEGGPFASGLGPTWEAAWGASTLRREQWGRWGGFPPTLHASHAYHSALLAPHPARCRECCPPSARCPDPHPLTGPSTGREEAPASPQGDARMPPALPVTPSVRSIPLDQSLWSSHGKQRRDG